MGKTIRTGFMVLGLSLAFLGSTLAQEYEVLQHQQANIQVAQLKQGNRTLKPRSLRRKK
jgi:hypothetical protein